VTRACQAGIKASTRSTPEHVCRSSAAGPGFRLRADEPLNFTERAAIAEFLTGYTGNTLVSCTTDLRLFVE
jgi:hypothetical protein